jgi:hypothetical protein
MKTKIILLSVAAILILGIIAGAIWWSLRPQAVTFSDDAKITLLKVEYGKHHAPPSVKASPATAANGRPTRTTRTGSFNTTNDTLVLWVRQEYPTGNNEYHYFSYYIYDKAGTACVQAGGSGGSNRGNEVVPIRVEAFPRREGKFYVTVEEGGNGGQEIAEKKFIISNPTSKSFSDWPAQTLPSTQTDDDLSVTLTKLVSGAQMPFTRGDADADDAMSKGVQAAFHVERAGRAVSNWLPVSIETFDATGNHVNGWSQTFPNNGNSQSTEWPNGDGTLTYQYGLWAREPWKIRLEFSQQSDFADYESWIVPALPVVPGKQQEMYNYGGNRRTAMTNAPFAETDLNGVHIKLFPAKQFTDAGNNNWMQGGLFIEINPDIPAGYRFTVKATDDQTNDIPCSQYGSNRNNNVASYRFRLQDIGGLTNLNVSIALHKSRFVEFTAKPEKAPDAADNAQ